MARWEVGNENYGGWEVACPAPRYRTTPSGTTPSSLYQGIRSELDRYAPRAGVVVGETGVSCGYLLASMLARPAARTASRCRPSPW